MSKIVDITTTLELLVTTTFDNQVYKRALSRINYLEDGLDKGKDYMVRLSETVNEQATEINKLQSAADVEDNTWAINALNRILNKQTGFSTLQDVRYYVKDELIKGGQWNTCQHGVGEYDLCSQCYEDAEIADNEYTEHATKEQSNE